MRECQRERERRIRARIYFFNGERESKRAIEEMRFDRQKMTRLSLRNSHRYDTSAFRSGLSDVVVCKGIRCFVRCVFSRETSAIRIVVVVVVVVVVVGQMNSECKLKITPMNDQNTSRTLYYIGLKIG